MYFTPFPAERTDREMNANPSLSRGSYPFEGKYGKYALSVSSFDKLRMNGNVMIDSG
jgi:hypothetical protein